MSWPLDTEQHRNGVFRGLLRTVEGGLSEVAAALWSSLPEPKEASVEAIARQCGFDSTGQGVLRDLLYLMISEQARYLQGIRTQLGSYEEPLEAGNGMMIDNRMLNAEHLAARRAEARLMLQEPRVTYSELDEEWMHLP